MKHTKYILPLAGLVAALVLCLPLTGFASGAKLIKVRPYAPEVPQVAPQQDEWTFAADRVVGDHNSEYVEGIGNCSLSLGENQLQADFARYYHATGWVYLKGNIRANWGGDLLQAEEGEFDLANLTGWLKNGKLFMAKPHMYVEADRVGKHEGDSYTFENAKITACDGESPAWAVSAEEGDIELDGEIQLYRSTFRIKDVPSFYWPYMSLPGRQKRVSGFLTPYMASSSKLGLQMSLPYYWVIDEESDATFYQNYMAKRGYMQGVEYRHVNDTATKGMWKLDMMKDRKTADSESDEFADYDEDGLIRPNSSRWWLRSKYDGWLGDPATKIKLDIDLVSDQNYLRDFQKGPSGYDDNSEEFLDTFGRDIEKKDDTTRTSVALLTRSWDRFGTAAKVQYVQNLEYMNGNGDDAENTTVQTLPELEAFAFQQNIAGTPIQGSAELKYDYFTRNKGHEGHRLRATPTVKAPMASEYGSFIPYAGVDYTAYNITGYEAYGDDEVVDSTGRTQSYDSSAVKKGQNSRTTWVAGFDAFTQATRVYTLEEDLAPSEELAGTDRWARVKHAVIPRLSYAFTPTITGQDEYAYFDEFDRIRGKNEVTYSITNVLDRRLDSVLLVPGGEDGPKTAVVSSYLDFLQLRFEQTYDINEATRNAELDEYSRRPFSDVLTELIIKPREYLAITSRTWVSPYIAAVTESENNVRLFDDSLGEVTLGYDYLTQIDEYKRYRSDTMSIIELGGKWYMTDAFTLRAKYRHDFNDSQDLERTIGLDWKADCYVLNFAYTSKPNDNRFEVGFNIMTF